MKQKRKYNPLKEITYELLLILASVLIFRSTWMLLDKHLNKSYILIQLIIGLTLSIILLHELNKK